MPLTGMMICQRKFNYWRILADIHLARLDAVRAERNDSDVDDVR